MTGEQSTFATLADLIGKPAALSLCEQFGGETIYIRKSIALDDGIWRPWGDTFGQDVAEKVLETLAGKRVYIPVAPPEMLAERNAAILQCLRHGKAATDIAKEFKLTPRYIAMIANRQGEQK